MTNNSDEKANVIAHYNDVAATYDRQYDRANLFTLEKYPANYFRLQNILKCLTECQTRRVYEVGTGEGTPLTAMAKAGFQVAGCDISENMVKATRNKLAESGLDPSTCQVADIENFSSFENQLANGPFDTLIAFGVIPHVQDDLTALRNMRRIVRSGGKVFIEFRNKLFSLFTFNRKTKEFILDDLLKGVSENVRTVVEKDIDGRLALDQPNARLVTSGGKPGYDAIPARFHNPFELPELFAAAGFRNPKIHWYHFHPAPPMLEKEIGNAFREEAIKMEGNTSDWRGNFLCSAGVMEADVED